MEKFSIENIARKSAKNRAPDLLPITKKHPEFGKEIPEDVKENLERHGKQGA